MSTYGFLPIVLISLLIYIISYSLTKTKYFKFVKHRRIWNILLLIAFLVTGTLGMFMSFIQSFDIDFEIPYTLLKIHVGFGMVWFIIAFFHFIWHLSYFKKAIKVIFISDKK